MMVSRVVCAGLLVTAAALMVASAAVADPNDAQCSDPTFAHSNPMLCGDYSTPFGVAGSGTPAKGAGGGGNGGLIGSILHGLGGLL